MKRRPPGGVSTAAMLQGIRAGAPRVGGPAIGTELSIQPRTLVAVGWEAG